MKPHHFHINWTKCKRNSYEKRYWCWISKWNQLSFQQYSFSEKDPDYMYSFQQYSFLEKSWSYAALLRSSLPHSSYMALERFTTWRKKLQINRISLPQKKVSLMKPWIIWSGIWLVLGLVNIVVALVSFNFASVLINISTWILAVYVFLVVCAYKLEIEQEGEEAMRHGILLQRILVFWSLVVYAVILSFLIPFPDLKSFKGI